MKTYPYKIAKIKPLTSDVVQALLEPIGESLQYQAGQYLNIHLDTGDARPFSIANAPLGSKQLELHIRHTPDNPYSNQLMTLITQASQINISGPHGRCIYHKDNPLPIIMVAGGTGFAPLKAILEEVFLAGSNHPVHLYWGAKTHPDLYLDHVPKRWAEHMGHFKFTPVLSAPHQDDYYWRGRVGNVYKQVLLDYNDLSHHQAYICGPEELAIQARQAFMEKGMAEKNIYSDWF